MTSEPGRRHPRGNGQDSDGFRLFLRFADGCRHQLEHDMRVSQPDAVVIHDYLYRGGARPSESVVSRVYHVAHPGLETVRKRLGRKSRYDPDVVREFYSRDHNRMMFDRGNLMCIAYPAKVLGVSETRPGSSRKPSEPQPACRARVGLEPVTGIFELPSDLSLKEGDWVTVHRMSIIEKVYPEFAREAEGFLMSLGLGKDRAFPEKAFKYLTEIRYSSQKRHESGDFADLSGD